jgi:uncharacterized RDD family membrane protein YckC
MDDYYQLLGVDEDAPVDDIRSAYRDKKAAVDTSAGDDAKSEVAKLNKAWNVLSDPYQRGRYDQERASTSDDVDDDDDDYEYEDDVSDAPVDRRSARAQARADRQRNARQPVKPTIKLPAGVRFPTMRQRLVAMGIDLLILIGLFLAGSVAVLPALEKSQHPVAYHAARKLVQDTIPDAEDDRKAAEKTAKTDTSAEAKKAVVDAKAKEDKLNDDLKDYQKVLLPLQNLVTAMVFGAALLVLVAPSLFGRQTLGKETQRIRILRLDGSPARFLDALRRYGALVLAGFALSLVIGPTGGLVAIFVATLWTRNPNQQGLQDRFAKTIVVADDES